MRPQHDPCGAASELTLAEYRNIAANSFALNPGNVEASALQLIRHERMNRNWCILTVTLAALAVGVSAAAYGILGSSAGGWLWWIGVACAVGGGLLGLLALLAAAVMARLVYNMKHGYRIGALTPGVIVSVDPLHYVAMTDLSTGEDEVERWAAKRIAPDTLPGIAPAIGTRLVCVSTYEPGPDPTTWADFAPYPVYWATADTAVIADRMAAIDEADFVRLEKVIGSGKAPREPLEVVRFRGSAKPRGRGTGG